MERALEIVVSTVQVAWPVFLAVFVLLVMFGVMLGALLLSSLARRLFGRWVH